MQSKSLKTNSLTITPLEAWIREKTRIGCELTDRSFVEALNVYQLQRTNEIIDYARRNTSFYRRHLASLPDVPLSALSDIARIPFTTPSDLTDNPLRFLAVRQDDIAKIVTLRTSGSTGEAKRLFFTEEDLELTVDFFHPGMSTLVRPGQRAVVLLPGEKRGDHVFLFTEAEQRFHRQLPFPTLRGEWHGLSRNRVRGGIPSRRQRQFQRSFAWPKETHQE